MAEAVILLRDCDGFVDIKVKLSPEHDAQSEAHKLVERILQQFSMEKVEDGNGQGSN
jgi:hypothetical protein